MSLRFPRAALILLAVTVLATPAAAQTASEDARITYHVQVTDQDIAADRFRVRLHLHAPLGPENAILQFASTAPGTYQVMDVGRFVENLHAYDAQRNEIPVEQVSTNQWRIGDPTRVSEVSYEVAETWDKPVEEHRIYPMAGTSIEADHMLFNAHAVLAFPQGLQDVPVRLDLGLLPGWTVATALPKDAEGFFLAEDYDHLVDSPILAGTTLTSSTTEVAGADIEIYAYSAGGGIRADMLLEAMESMLEAAGSFLDGLPVDRYVFLYHFEGAPAQGASYGAWEHSYSSEYVFPDVPWSERYASTIKDVAAHEFLHIVTPLNIHSEIIERFNFETPVPSRHLWLYEGVTEWGAHMSQLRAGIKTPEAYLEEMARKIAIDRQYFDAATSLEELALTSYTDEGHRQYGNIYMRGALVAGLLDIRLLELSSGERDLQDLLLALMERYGKEDPFDDAGLYGVLAEMTDPAIGDFLQSYVRDAEPLPIAESSGKLGIGFVDEGTQPRFVIRPDPTAEQARLRTAWLGRTGTISR
jgi:predicted metalloprotease with PDZ domain